MIVYFPSPYMSYIILFIVHLSSMFSAPIRLAYSQSLLSITLIILICSLKVSSDFFFPQIVKSDLVLEIVTLLSMASLYVFCYFSLTHIIPSYPSQAGLLTVPRTFILMSLHSLYY